MSEPEITDWKKRESLGSALWQIVVVALLLGGAVTFTYRRAVDRQTASEQIEKARALIQLDTAKELRAAIEAVTPAFESTTRDDDAHAVAARAFAELWLVHRQADAEKAAREHLSLAGSTKVEERVTAQALIDIAVGKPQDAIAALDPITHRGARRLDLEVTLARAQLAAGQQDAAAATLARSAEVAVRDPRVHTLRAEVLMTAGLTDQAIAAYEQALLANSQHPTARLGLALARAAKSHSASELESTVASLRQDGLLTPEMEQQAAQARAAVGVATDTP